MKTSNFLVSYLIQSFQNQVFKVQYPQKCTKTRRIPERTSRIHSILLCAFEDVQRPTTKIGLVV